MPRIGGRRSYNPGGQRNTRRPGQPSMRPRGYGQGMDRRGGARTGVLSKANKPFGMRPKSGGMRPNPGGMRQGLGGGSKLGGMRPSLGNRRRRRPSSRPNPRGGLGGRRGY